MTALFAADPVSSMSLELRIPLSVMTFLEFAIWGAWFVVLGNYLNSLQFSRKDIGRIYGTMAFGAIISPMFVGTIADQYFASEQLMGVLHLLGAALMFWMSRLRNPRAFFWVALAYASAYTPTLSLSNAVIFANVPTSGFPEIRVLGTIGWIAAGLSLRLFIKPGQPMNNSPLLLAAVLSVILGVYSFFLPESPPKASGSGGAARVTDMGVTLAVKEPGSGYQEAPKIAISGGGGAGASATATIENGKIKELNVVPGNGYTSAPTVTLEGGGGSGAKIESGLKVLTAEVVSPGSGYKAKRMISVVGEKGGGAAVEADLNQQDGSVKAVHVILGGSGYPTTPKLVFPEPGIPFIKALQMFKEPSFAVFLVMSFLITIALAFYFGFTGVFLEQAVGVKASNVGPLMTIGQWVEIFFLLTLGWFITHLGMKWVLVLGMAAWAIRYFIFAMRPPLALAIVGIALHGICFDFFLGAGFMHTDIESPADIKASAQSLYGVLTYGLGMWIGNEASGWLNQACTRETVDPTTGQTVKVTNWSLFWSVPAIAVAIALPIFWFFFEIDKKAS